MLATYEMIQNEVRFADGFVPKACWIAHVLEQLSCKFRVAPNRIDAGARKNPCPEEKRGAIIEAVRKVGVRNDDDSR